jgi:hypothetical protein
MTASRRCRQIGGTFPQEAPWIGLSTSMQAAAESVDRGDSLSSLLGHVSATPPYDAVGVNLAGPAQRGR